MDADAKDPDLNMTLTELVKRACEEPTLLDALTFASIVDTERAVAQARRNNFKSWVTCSRLIFQYVIEEYAKKDTPMFKEEELVVDTRTGIEYYVTVTPGNIKDFITELPSYQISRNSMNPADTLWTVPQLVMESGRFKKVPTS